VKKGRKPTILPRKVLQKIEFLKFKDFLVSWLKTERIVREISPELLSIARSIRGDPRAD
jgi:hypothetical protein